MSYREMVTKKTPGSNGPVVTGEVILSLEINGKMKHLYNMSRKDMTDEEYEKEYRRCYNLCPMKGETWVKNTESSDEIIFNIDISFSSDDLDRPDSNELDELDRLVGQDEDYSSDFAFSSEE